MDNQICEKCGYEIELLPKEYWVKGQSKWIHSGIQKGRHISLSEAEKLNECEAVPKKR